MNLESSNAHRWLEVMALCQRRSGEDGNEIIISSIGAAAASVTTSKVD